MKNTSISAQKLKQVKLLLLDVDGVFTDGSIIYNDQGEESKIFHVRDGLGIKLLQSAGINVGIVTGRRSRALLHRCKELGIDLIYDGVRDKSAVWEQILEQSGVQAHEIAFVGDDLVDLPLLKKVGIFIAVADAHEEVLQHAHMVTTLKGGHGAVREVCEAILKAQGLWKGIMAQRFQRDEAR